MKRLFIALGVLILVVGLLIMTRLFFSFRDLGRRIRAEPAYTSAIVEKAGGADAVLIACRQMLETFAPNENQLFQEVPLADSRIPQIMRNMHLSSINVCIDRVRIKLDEPGRIGLLAFREGATQYGTSMITNCLWYWNGTPSKETRSAYLDMQAKVREYYDKGSNPKLKWLDP